MAASAPNAPVAATVSSREATGAGGAAAAVAALRVVNAAAVDNTAQMNGRCTARGNRGEGGMADTLRLGYEKMTAG